MADVRTIKITNLRLDAENPRLGLSPSGADWNQPSMFEYFASRADVRALATDIASRGLNPSKRPLVMQADNTSSGVYVVLEGNRRLAALRLLKQPTLAGSAQSQSFKQLAKQAGSLPDEVDCAVVDSREEADHWLRMEHGLGRSGTSTIEWGPSEKSRFEERTKGEGGGRYSKSTALLDTLVQSGHLQSAAAATTPITTLDRLLNDPYVREVLRLDFENLAVDDSNRPSILTLLYDLVAPGKDRVSVDRVKTKSQRAAYVDGLAGRSPPSGSTGGGGGAGGGGAGRQRAQRAAHARKHLIPGTFKPTIKHPRLRELYTELREINLERHDNAAAVLFRVFLEICIWDFYKRRGLAVPGKFDNAVKKAAQHLKTEGHIEQGAESVVVRACDDDASFVSIKSLHQYVHGPYDYPSPKQLNRLWDSFEPFFAALIAH